jgi:exopolysaccharide biosynthesis WecB/TagA/CpsF family protein
VGRLRGIGFPDRIAGPDLVPRLSEALARRGGATYFFLGSTEDVLRRIEARVARSWPSIRVVGTLSPPFRATTDEEEAAQVAAINAARPDVLWVGMTAPKQELWVERNRHRLTVPLVGSVGAAFDYLAETKSEARGGSGSTAWNGCRVSSWSLRVSGAGRSSRPLCSCGTAFANPSHGEPLRDRRSAFLCSRRIPCAPRPASTARSAVSPGSRRPRPLRTSLPTWTGMLSWTTRSDTTSRRSSYTNLRALERTGARAPIPDHVRTRLQSDYFFSLALMTTFQNAFGAIAGALGARRIEWIPLKGLLFGRTLYGSPDVRTMNDLDFLVRPEKLDAASAVLEDLGYTRSIPPGGGPPTKRCSSVTTIASRAPSP